MPRIAREAVNALAALDTPESRQLLTDLAAKADHPARTAIAVAFYRVDPAAAETLVKALFADQDVKVPAADRQGCQRHGRL